MYKKGGLHISWLKIQNATYRLQKITIFISLYFFGLLSLKGQKRKTLYNT